MAETHRFRLSLVLNFFVFGTAVSSDADILLAFKATFSDPSGSLRSWSAGSGSSPCTGPAWRGVYCNSDGRVFRIQLEGMGLSGQLKLDGLTELTALRTVSFSNNSFDGPMPDLKKIKRVKSAYLSMNKLSGKIPDDAFKGMRSLRKIDLSRNRFTGPIPSSLAEASKILEVRMNDNAFDGEIPDFTLSPELSMFDVSNNNLEGRIPEGLSKMDATMFVGNKDLCGSPLTVQCKLVNKPAVVNKPAASADVPPQSSDKHGLDSSITIAITVTTIGVVLAAVGAALAVLRARKHKTGQQEETQKPLPVQKPKKLRAADKSAVAVAAVGDEDEEQGELLFVRDDRERFELHDLLRASAEILGGGELGSSYKATLLNRPSVVVKRFKEMNGFGEAEFHEHMRRLGRLSHPNLLPLVAYYYRKEEKLLVTDYIAYGSLASLLHGNRSPNNPNLDWHARLRIVKGIARGLSYLYKELSMTTSAPHGHLKSSNVLLDENLEPLLTDYALVPVMNQSQASKTLIAYKSPEYKQFGRLSKKSDVWSFGVLILEILTGKFPGNYSRQMDGASDLANWVNSVVREEWTGEVFDGDMKRTRNAEGDMLMLLQIGLGCCEVDTNKRWDLKRALQQIEELKERAVDDDGYSFLSEGDVFSRPISEDDFSFSMNR